LRNILRNSNFNYSITLCIKIKSQRIIIKKYILYFLQVATNIILNITNKKSIFFRLCEIFLLDVHRSTKPQTCYSRSSTFDHFSGHKFGRENRSSRNSEQDGLISRQQDGRYREKFSR